MYQQCTIIITSTTSGMVNHGSAGSVWQPKKEEKKTHEAVNTRQELTTAQRRDPPTPTYGSTAERSTAVTPTKRSTHPPCITVSVNSTGIMTYSSSRGRERAVKPSWVQKTKVRDTSNTHSHEHTRSHTHPPTHRPNNPPTHRSTHPRCATAIQQSTAAAAADALMMMIQTELQ